MSRFPLLAAVLIPALLAGAPPARSRPGEDEGAAARRGAAWLLAHQLPVGGWVSDEYGLTSPGHKLAITAVCAHALLATESSDAAAESARKAVRFIERYVRELELGKRHDGFDFNAWGIAYGLAHLRGVADLWPPGSEPPGLSSLVERFVGYARKMQGPTGGWDYRPGSKGSVPFLTAVMIEGLRAWDADAEMVGRAVRDLERSADENGFVGYSHDGEYEQVTGRPWYDATEAAGRSVQARLTLVGCGKEEPGSLLPLLRHFFRVRGEYEKVRNRHAHTKPHMIAGYYYYHAHYYAMRAVRRLLAAAPEREEEAAAWVETLRAALLREQAEEGYWLDAPCGGKPYATALALLEIAEMREVLVPWLDSLPDALRRAKAKGRPVVLLFEDDNAASRSMEALFYGPLLRPAVGRVVLVRADLREQRDLAHRAKVYRAPSLVVLDSAVEEPLAHPLRKVIGRRTPEKVRSLLDKVLDELSERSR